MNKFSNQSETDRGVKLWIPFGAFLFTFIFMCLMIFDGLEKIPGDIGDARLNNYFLENIFQFLIGKTDSLWHLSFFYPFPYILGFSDNLFGSAPIYVLARLLGIKTDDSFQIWFLFGYVANFIAAYYALRRLDGSVLAATVGALIFAFALPTAAHAGHAQLHYRFGLPLVLVFFSDFLNSKLWRYFLIASAWLVWQFYAGVYIGFFTILLMSAMSLTYFSVILVNRTYTIKFALKEFHKSWQLQSKNKKLYFISSLIFLLLLLFLLFYPYWQVSQLYAAKRSWSEISLMLPRPQSYFLADNSLLWSRIDEAFFSNIPMRHEHQMFIGLVPFILALAGLLIGSRKKNGLNFILFNGMLGITIILTLYVAGFSLWYLFHKLPLASAIRVISRLDQAFLFPVAYLTVIALDTLQERFKWGAKAIFLLVLPLLIFEAGMTVMSASTKDSWRQRLTSPGVVVPNNLPDNAILFFAQQSGPVYADEIDAMWVSLKYHKSTMNGYSGNYPPGYDYDYGSDCAEVPKRVLSYLRFSNQIGNIDLYRELMSRIVPVGFINCDPSWLETAPAISFTDRTYTQSEFANLSYSSGEIIKVGNADFVRVIISNSSEQSFAATSATGNPIRLSWRFVDSNEKPLSGWDTRKNLPFDIPSKGKLEVWLPLDSVRDSNVTAVQVSLVQEGVFWLHDIGLEPMSVFFN